ncbi:hypothetical protein GW17_00049908, partial [Ensete ventricosum]
NQKVHCRPIKVGDLVLQIPKVSDPTYSWGKLAPNWERPYWVIDVVCDETYHLVTHEGV